MSEKKPTGSEVQEAIVTAKLASRAPFIVIVTPEWTRVKPYLFKGAADGGYEARFWDIAAGFTDISGKVLSDAGQGDADGALDAIKANRSRVCWVMRDLTPWISAPLGLITVQKLKNLIEWMPQQGGDRAQSIIMVTSNPDIPPEIANEAQVIEWPMPDREEMGKILDDQCAPVLSNTAVDDNGEPKVSAEIKKAIRDSITGDARGAAIDAAIGLSGSEAESCFATSIVTLFRIDPVTIAQEKKRVIAKEKLMEWIEPPEGGLDDAGGWEEYKAWARKKVQSYTPAAREFGIRSPKGAFLVGVSGCGKSLCAKGTAGEWGVPIIKLDLGALKDKFVGQSEANLRKALNLIEALGWCIVWIDEIEKALAGATGEAGDGGVAQDALGAILTWMQDRRGDAFVIATANDVTKLPPELMRKGRFDAVWWVDLPTRTERAAIVAAAMRTAQREGSVQFDVDCDAVAEATGAPNGEPRFTGAEIAALIPDAMDIAFADGARTVTTDDLLLAATDVVPLAETKKEDIEELRRTWSKRARPVSRPDVAATKVVSDGRKLDIFN